jgi:hypothetical protein
MDTLFDREYACQVCDNTFKSKQVRTSAVRPKSRDKDFHAYYIGDNPTHYGVICCPYCGFAQFENDFKSKISEIDKAKIKKNITSRWHYQNFSLARSYEQVIKVYLIAMMNYKVIEASYYTFGKLYLRLAWCYREMKDETQELKYIELSSDAFTKSFETEDYSDKVERELEILYMLGELNRQLKRYDLAVTWFDKVLTHPEIYKNQLIKKFAREQWNLTSEENRAYKLESERGTS